MSILGKDGTCCLLSALAVDGERHKLLHRWPTERAAEMVDLPSDDVQADRIEAWNSYLQGQHRAAILMARSALQRAVRTLLTHPEGTLDERDKGSLNGELDLLRTRGVITQQLRDNADEVRYRGMT